MEALLSNDQYSVVWESGEQERLSGAEIEKLAATNPNVNIPATSAAARAAATTTSSTAAAAAAPAAAAAATTTYKTSSATADTTRVKSAATTAATTSLNPALSAKPQLPLRKDSQDATIWEVWAGQVPGVAVKARGLRKSSIACMQPDSTRCVFRIWYLFLGSNRKKRWSC